MGTVCQEKGYESPVDLLPDDDSDGPDFETLETQGAQILMLSKIILTKDIAQQLFGSNSLAISKQATNKQTNKQSETNKQANKSRYGLRLFFTYMGRSPKRGASR